ncbi:uncharacterized protein PV07_05600 [Cladophialophora immunda]|uniref:TIGR00267 family protein n=1 Tax=Cladophialophora immunda TaxID=569365 RepID=A0A0D2CFB9_9EURO|nr:uncharacterized protein PV07_05600 [Cladophialophora immunda]KIW29813.1 hypothetical protein PV07_05600 [Cladophialophora immunda]OQV08706.1 hypothetical protein CLAIMM_12933 [Cladophialophora immunda]
MLVSMFRFIFSRRYVPVLNKTPSDLSEKEFDLESTGSETSEASTLTGSDKPSFKPDSRIISDAIIGLSDGLTVPFALTAGLSALGDTRVVIYGGLAELIAGAISMGLGGYLGAKSEEESYHATRKQTKDQILNNPISLSESISAIFEPYNLPEPLTADLTTHLEKCDPDKIVNFIMSFEYTLPEPASSRAFTCALTIALGYFIGGFVPLLPYFFTDNITKALVWSIGTMGLALFLFGYVKTCVNVGWHRRRHIWQGVLGGAQMVFVGGAAAGAAMGIVRAFDYHPVRD